MEKKTPLFNWHETHGGKIVPFAGFLLPIQYETGLMTEHCAVREKAGLFDVSHMSELVISGKGALDTIQMLFTNDFANLAVGRVRYTHVVKDFDCSFFRLVAAHTLIIAQGFANLPAYGFQGIKACHGVLHNHGYLFAAMPLPVLVGLEFRYVFSVIIY